MVKTLLTMAALCACAHGVAKDDTKQIAQERANEIACPAALHDVDQKLLEAPDGWQTFQGPSQHVLTGVEVTIGHPREQSGAIYDSVTPIKRRQVAQILRWQLAKLHEPHLVCHYFDTDVALTRSVSGYATCELVEQRVGAQKRPERARCYR